jgi:hypothetical protein
MQNEIHNPIDEVDFVPEAHPEFEPQLHPDFEPQEHPED